MLWLNLPQHINVSTYIDVIHSISGGFRGGGGGAHPARAPPPFDFFL